MKPNYLELDPRFSILTAFWLIGAIWWGKNESVSTETLKKEGWF